MSSPGAGEAPLRPVSIWNLANALTGLRLLLVPVFGWMLLHGDDGSHRWRTGALIAFLVASITDRVDGEVARRRGLVTDLGKIADPIADKALIGTALVALSILDELPWWVTALVMGRELGVTALRLVVIRHAVMPASRGGKVKTFLQALAIGLYVLPRDWVPLGAAEVVMAGAVLVTLATGVDYAVRAMRLRRTSPRALAKRARQGSGA